MIESVVNERTWGKKYLPRALTKLDLKIFGGPKAVIPKNDIFKLYFKL